YYYPYGKVIGNQESYAEGFQPYKFGGKEAEPMFGLGLYDFEARQLDKAVPRFTTMDPHAESYYNWSPYAYAANNPIRNVDPTGEDWYQHDESGATFWEDSSLDFIERGDQRYHNIGQYYTQPIDDGITVFYDQDKVAGINEPYYFEQAVEREPSFMEKWSDSDNILANLSYNILNDAFVSIQPLTFGLIGETTNEFTGGIAHTNLDGTTNYKGIESFTNTITWALPTGEAKVGLAPLKTLNAAQFSHTFKGILSGLKPATRGTINRTMNTGTRAINSQIGNGNAVIVPIGIGSYYKSK
ncbi:RHS repeat-associated core domain-containing protein, partial [Viscerimonas tarda]